MTGGFVTMDKFIRAFPNAVDFQEASRGLRRAIKLMINLNRYSGLFDLPTDMEGDAQRFDTYLTVTGQGLVDYG